MNQLICDGCGRQATAEHIATRIARLEQATRYRPIHIQTLFVADAPGNDRRKLEDLLDELKIPAAKNEDGSEEGKPEDPRLEEFQRRGFCLAYVIECPIEDAQEPELHQKFAT